MPSDREKGLSRVPDACSIANHTAVGQLMLRAVVLASSKMPVVPREYELQLLRKRMSCDLGWMQKRPHQIAGHFPAVARDTQDHRIPPYRTQASTAGQPREKLRGSAEAGDTEVVTAATDAIWPVPRTSDLGEVVKEEAERVKAYPLMHKEPEVIGWVYRVDNLNISPKIGPDS